MSRLTDAEVLDIIRRLQTGGYGSDEENNAKVMLLNDIYLGMSDLIYWDRRELTPEQILEEAKKRKPIVLGPGTPVEEPQ